MRFLEKDLEDIVASTPLDQLRARGLSLPLKGKLYRQLRIGNYGIADLVHVWRDYDYSTSACTPILFIKVLELKQDQVNEKTLMQAVKYATGIKNYILNHRGKDIELDIQLILIGRSVCNGDFFHAADALPNVRILTYDYEFDGIKFYRHSRTYLKNEGF